MKNKLFTIMALGMFVLAIGFSAAASSESSTLKASIYPSVVNISVPDEILMPHVAPGYISPETGFDVKNVGTSDISITAQISEMDEVINYNTVFFKKNLNDPASSLEGFSFDILKPTYVGDDRTERIFAILNLENYTGEITEPMINQSYPITFTAMAYNI